jgi:hypothetical protein
VRLTTSSTRARVRGETAVSLFKARDTVIAETPASSATAFMVMFAEADRAPGSVGKSASDLRSDEAFFGFMSRRDPLSKRAAPRRAAM